MGENGVIVYPEAAKAAAPTLDPNLMLAMQNGGGFGANSWIWILFLWAMWQNGGYQNFRNQGGSFADLAAQINGDAGRDFILQALNGRFDSLGQLANITNTSVESVKNGIFTLQSAIQNVGAQTGMSGLQVQNAVQAGNAAISQKLCECCCENRLAICNQTNTLQSQAASNFAATQLQTAQNHADDRLDVCQQTNELKTQSIQNTQSIKDAIAAQSIMINDKFCDLEKRELQNRITTQGDIITQLRGQISNDKQTEAFNTAFNSLNDKINIIASKQPNTVPVQWPNIVAANATPYIGQPYYGNYYPQNNFWG